MRFAQIGVSPRKQEVCPPPASSDILELAANRCDCEPSAEFGQTGVELNRSTQRFHRIRLLDIGSQAFCADAGSIEEQSDPGPVA